MKITELELVIYNQKTGKILIMPGTKYPNGIYSFDVTRFTKFDNLNRPKSNYLTLIGEL